MDDRKTRVGYMGIPFSNSWAEAKRLSEEYGIDDYELVDLMCSGNVVRELLSDSIDFGVVAVRNKFAGIVKETEDALFGQDCIETVLEGTIQIHHCVFVKNEDCVVKTIVSHIQALMQSEKNLKRFYPHCDFVECEDTAYAAEMLADGTLSDDCAAVCRRDAGEHYGLHLVHENVEDNPGNETVFALIRKNRK